MLDKDLYARFWSKVKVLKKRQCWEWLSSTSNTGYGQLSVKNIPRAAHRMSYEYFNGPIPEGLWVDHVCMNKSCVNPNHLRLVTPQVSSTENTNGVGAKNAQKTHCKNGHEYSKENTHIHKLGGRRCKTCVREYDNKRKQRARALLAKLKESE